MIRLSTFFRSTIEMGKVRIALPVALSALAGFSMQAGRLESDGWLLGLGVFFMSCGSGALNQWQERQIDARMPRTRNRPIPSGRITSNTGLLITLLFLSAGSLVLLFTQPEIALALSWLTLFFYNLVYTPLKKVTAFAVIPGSMVGAIPPIIGWTAAGGSIFSEGILLVAIFFFIGQIPHFWLLLLLFGKQYALAGLPSLNQLFSESQIKRVTYTWVLTTVAAALLVIFFVLTNRVIIVILLFYALFLLTSLSVSMWYKKDLKVRPAFYQLNFFYLFMMIFIIADSLLREGAIF